MVWRIIDALTDHVQEESTVISILAQNYGKEDSTQITLGFHIMKYLTQQPTEIVTTSRLNKPGILII